MDDPHETARLNQELSELKGRLQRLQISRRVLMNLLERFESEKAIALDRLIRENEELKEANLRLNARLRASRERVWRWQALAREKGLDDLLEEVEKGLIHNFIHSEADFVSNKKILPIVP